MLKCARKSSAQASFGGRAGPSAAASCRARQLARTTLAEAAACGITASPTATVSIVITLIWRREWAQVTGEGLRRLVPSQEPP